MTGSSSSVRPEGAAPHRPVLALLLILRGAGLTLLAAGLLVGVSGPLWPVGSGGFGPGVWAMAALTGVTAVHLAAKRPVGEAALLVHLCLDVAALTLLFSGAGGAANPFVFLLLVPVAITASVANSYAGVGMLTVAALAYASLFLGGGHHHHGGGEDFRQHLLGMYLGFLLAGVLLVVSLWRVRAVLDAQREALRLERERAGEDRSLLRLAMFAVGAAHELGTPLGTLHLAAQELEAEAGGDEALSPLACTILRQTTRCKEILAGMLDRSGQSRALAGAAMTPRAFMDSLAGDWMRERPEAYLDWRWEAEEDGPLFLADATLRQALVTLLDNAAKANARTGGGGIMVRGGLEDGRVRFSVRDQGPGLEASAGDGGLGIGLWLARQTLSRMGGELHLRQAPQGALAEVFLPLSGLRVKA